MTELIGLKARHISNSQILQNVNQLVQALHKNESSILHKDDFKHDHFTLILIPDEQDYYSVTSWLYNKLEKRHQNVFKIHGLCIWAKEKNNQDLHKATVIENIAEDILEDMTVLGEK